MSESMEIRKGDRFIQQHPAARWPIFIEVTRVGKTGWVDIACYTWAVHWRKRMPLGLGPMLEHGHPSFIEPSVWTDADIAATIPESLAP